MFKIFLRQAASLLPYSGAWRNHAEGPPDLEKILRTWWRKWFGNEQKPKTHFGPLGLSLSLLLLSTYLLAGVIQLSPQEAAVVMRLGRYQTTLGPGLHWLAPIVTTYKRANVEGIEAIKLHALMLTQDENLILVQGVAKYKIRNLYDYYFNDARPNESLRQAAESALRQAIGRSSLDNILTLGHLSIADSIHLELQKTLDLYQAGLEVQEIDLHSTKVPDEVQSAFDEVTKASQQKESQINEAAAYAGKTVLIAKGQAERVLAEAQGQAQEILLKAQGETARFNFIEHQYRASPKIMQTRLYIETLEQIFSRIPKVWIDNESNQQLIYLPLDRFNNARANYVEENSQNLNQGLENLDALNSMGRN